MYPLHASLLWDVTAVMAARATSAIAGAHDLLVECLGGCSGRSAEDVQRLAQSRHAPLIEALKSHAAVFGSADAGKVDLPVERVDSRSEQWQLVCRLYTKYLVVPNGGVY